MALEPTSDPVVAAEEKKLIKLAVDYYAEYWIANIKRSSVLAQFINGKGGR